MSTMAIPELTARRKTRFLTVAALQEAVSGAFRLLPRAAGLVAAVAKWVSGADVRWLWRPEEDRPRIYFANHASHLDALVLWAALPAAVRRVTRPVAAQDYWSRPGLRWFVASRLFRSILVPRIGSGLFGGRDVLAPMLRELDRGGSLILFPEGTRGDGGEVAEFKGGLYQLCRERSELEAVPVYLENLHRVLPKGEFLPVPGASRVTFGKPLRLEPGEGRPDFLGRARESLRALRR